MNMIGSSGTTNGNFLPITAGVFGAFVVVGLAYVGTVLGPRYRSAVDQTNASAIAREDDEYCAKLGAQASNDALAQCKRILNEVRANQTRRDDATMAGL